jgi:hypothetical protein
VALESRARRDDKRNDGDEGAVTAGGQSATCDLPCALRIGEKSEPARLRACSLSRCFVQTDARPATGQTVCLDIAGGASGASRVAATVVRSGGQRVLDEETVRGVELHLTEVDAPFFTIYSDLCRTAEPTASTPLSLAKSLPLLSAGKPKPRDRRAAERRALELAVRIFDDGVKLMGVPRNVSHTGAYIVAELAPPVGASLHLEFLSRRSFYAEAVVVRTGAAGDPAPDDAGEQGFGVRFLSIEDMLTRVLRDARTLCDTRTSGGRELSLIVATAAELEAIRRQIRETRTLALPGAEPLSEGACIRVGLQHAAVRGRTQRQPFYVKGRVLAPPAEPGAQAAATRLEVLNAETTEAWLERQLREE